MKLPPNKTKIVATIGPASDAPEMLERLIHAGLNVARLNFSHGSHADHVATGQATWAAVYPDARNPFAFPELLTSGYEPWTVSEMWIINHPDSNDTVDITQQFDRKIRALRCHASQHQHPEQMEGNVRAWNERNAAAGGLEPGRLAERFFVVDSR